MCTFMVEAPSSSDLLLRNPFLIMFLFSFLLLFIIFFLLFVGGPLLVGAHVHVHMLHVSKPGLGFNIAFNHDNNNYIKLCTKSD
jgi:hypothetical protein